MERMSKDTIITVQNQRLRDEFLKTIENIFKKHKNVADYLKEIAGKSTVTFNHSVNVAFHVFEMLRKDKNFLFTKEEIERWTEAALVHDVGKLNTPNSILHAPQKLSDAEYSTMMRHSIEGYNYGKNEYKFEKEDIAAIIGHHIDAKYLDGGVERNFEGASKSRPQWKFEFPEERYIENLLTENLSWMREKDIYALETISFCDVVEALRSEERQYHNNEKHDWTIPKPNNVSIKQVVQIWDIDTTEKEAISKKFDGIVLDKRYQKQFDSMQQMNMPTTVRNMVSEIAKDKKVRVSKDTMKEIKQHPELGTIFTEKQISKENGQEYFVIRGEKGTRALVFGTKVVPDLQKGPIDDKDIIDEFSNEGFGMLD